MQAVAQNTIPADRGRRAAIAATLTGANLVVLAVGAMHILVWNPLAKVPGMSLAEIYERMRLAGEGSLAGKFVADWVVFWGVFSLAYLLLYLLPITAGFLSTKRMAALGLLMVGLTSLGSWWANFNMGMSLADTFFTDAGGRGAPAGLLLPLLGVICVVAAAVVAARRTPGELAAAEV